MSRFAPILFVICLLFAAGSAFAADQPKSQQAQEIADDGTPVLIKHLPGWETVRSHAALIHSAEELKKAIGDRPVLSQIEFIPGTEAVTAKYDAGTLLIVEYMSPQVSVEVDDLLQGFLADPANAAGIAYRRIGNYNALVLDGADSVAAAALLDQVKYEKQVSWMGDNPFTLHRAERNFVITTTDLFISTLLAVVYGLGFSLVFGIMAGIAFFYVRERIRLTRSTFTDAGGMTRLNLDGFTPDMTSSRLLEE